MNTNIPNNEEIQNDKIIENDNTDVEEYVSYTPATLEDDLKKMDFTYHSTANYRSKLLNKLEPIVMSMHIETDVSDRESAAALDSQMSVINTYMSLLNDTEKSIKQKIEIKTRQKELLENGKKTDAFMEALDIITKKYSEEFIKNQMVTSSETLNKRIVDENITVSEQELREDPTDLS